jgi:serine/threonine-protein kinase
VHDKVLDKEMAIKMLRQDLAAADGGLLVRRFEQEARSALEMTHVNVVAAYGQGHNKDGAPYLVMEYVAGESLARLIQTTGALEIHQALGIFMQVCEALAHAHMKNLIHRDIKSANVLLQHTDDGGNLVKLVDFGIAKTLPLFEFETLGLTQTGEILGSPAYMSPEHCLGEPVDERSDMYSLGCVMYEALTGQPPFADKHPIKAIMQHLKTAPPSLARRVRIEDQPGMAAGFNFQIYREAIDSVIMRCLEKDPARRYQSADELRLDLEALSKDILPQPRTNKNPAGRPAFWPEGPSDKGVVQPQKEGRPEAAITLIVLILVLIALWIARAI